MADTSKYIYKGRLYEGSEIISEGLFSTAKPGYSKKPTLGRSAVFFYVEDANTGEPGYVNSDMQNPILLDYISFCPNVDYAKKLKEKYIQVNKVANPEKVHVIKRTKEVVG